MEEVEYYENFPLRFVFLANLFGISVYALGAYILAGFGMQIVILYLVYCAFIEFRVLKRSCVSCYYYGRLCCFGKGRLASLFLERGEPRKFSADKISWRDLLPDFMVSILPFIGGIVLLMRGFNWALLGALAVLVLFSSAGNAVIRGSFACRYCKQRELGCPAEELFRKKA